MPHQCTNCGRTFADGSKEMLSGCPDCSGTKFQFRPDGFDSSEAGPDDEPATGDAAPGDGSLTPESSEPADRGDAVSRTVGSAAATVRDLVGGSAAPDATDARPPSGTAAGASGSGADARGDDTGEDDIIIAESEPVDDEDLAQADARSQTADPDEVPGDGFSPATDTGSADNESDPGGDPDAAAATAGESGATTDDAAGESGAADTIVDPPAVTGDAGERSVTEEPDTERADRPDLAELREELNEQFESIRVVEPGQYELNLMELYDREEYIIALQEDGRYSIQVPETWREADV
jgi:predicted  nucleic acid-binding Zn-ribbon protein